MIDTNNLWLSIDGKEILKGIDNMMNSTWTIVHKESAQMLRSQRGLVGLLTFSGLLSAFSLLLVSNTELSLLDNAQVVYMMIKFFFNCIEGML